MFPAERIVCLTEETVETLYLLGEQDRIVGISGYCVRPPEARRDKPRVSAFTSADIPKILDLKPDLVLSFSDLQADIVAALIRRGIAVHAFNQRSIAEIFDMIRMLGAMVGAADRADRLAAEIADGLAEARRRAARLPYRPRVYFEEWNEPMISGIAWVSELIEIAGGMDIFFDRACGKSAQDRIVTEAEIIARMPDVIIGAWCGKKFRPEKVVARPGFAQIPAVQNNAVHEIKSPLILQPAGAAAPASRVISLNLCTDQLVLALADRSAIVSVTYLARDCAISAQCRAAASEPINYGTAEELVAAEPDLVLGGRYTTRPAIGIARRLGMKVLEFDPPSSLDMVRRQIRDVAEALGRSERGEAMIADLDGRLAALPQAAAKGERPVAAVYQANSVTVGANSLIDAALQVAGVDNLARRLGLRKLHVSAARNPDRRPARSPD